IAGKVEGPVGDIAGDAKTQAEGRVREATGAAQNLYGQAKDTVRETTDAAASYAKDTYENSGDTFRDSAQAIAKKVQDNPLGSMLIAGGIGFALALLMTRPPRRPPPRWRYYGRDDLIGTLPTLVDWPFDALEIKTVSDDDIPLAPSAYDGVDPGPDPKSAIAEVSEA